LGIRRFRGIVAGSPWTDGRTAGGPDDQVSAALKS
jgi:hypothetical protein